MEGRGLVVKTPPTCTLKYGGVCGVVGEDCMEGPGVMARLHQHAHNYGGAWPCGEDSAHMHVKVRRGVVSWVKTAWKGLVLRWSSIYIRVKYGGMRPCCGADSTHIHITYGRVWWRGGKTPSTYTWLWSSFKLQLWILFRIPTPHPRTYTPHPPTRSSSSGSLARGFSRRSWFAFSALRAAYGRLDFKRSANRLHRTVWRRRFTDTTPTVTALRSIPAREIPPPPPHDKHRAALWRHTFFHSLLTLFGIVFFRWLLLVLKEEKTSIYHKQRQPGMRSHPFARHSSVGAPVNVKHSRRCSSGARFL